MFCGTMSEKRTNVKVDYLCNEVRRVVIRRHLKALK